MGEVGENGGRGRERNESKRIDQLKGEEKPEGDLKYEERGREAQMRRE